ncbi:MAG: P-loop NTPase family protein [Planctomycetota bacterium]|jgi:phospholipid/cholesterol/gamma-HCH transport system ATP-binding protein
MDSARSVLTFDCVTVEASADYDTPLWNVSFELGSGQLALVLLEASLVRTPLADAAQGLVEPAHGCVRFDGHDWCRMPARQASRCRARVGRMFEGYGWIDSMGVDENVGLKELHHTNRALRDIEDEAAELALVFGLPGLPRGQPSQLRENDLRRAAFVRTFLGAPDLFLLERPTAGLFPRIMPALLTKIRSVRAHGAAVVWLTDNLEVWGNSALHPDRRYRMSGTQMIEERER